MCSALAGAAVRDGIQLGLYGMRATFHAGAQPLISSEPHDGRFLDENWQRWPFNLIQQSFLLTERWWREAATNVPGVSKHHEDAVAFTMRQILDVLSPSNSVLTNPTILAATIHQRGANLRRGAMNFAEDWTRLLAGERPVGTENFVPGERVAVTPGSVVYRNNVIELIQYAPSTPTVYREPIVLVPAWILKYYILDLSPHNSLVKYLVDNGHCVFVISWKNPTAEDRDLSFEDYRKSGLMAALEAVSAIVPDRQIHAAGYCLGGTLLALAAAAMAGCGDERLKTMTLFAAQVDFTEAGDLSTFIDEDQVGALEDLMQVQGYLDTRQLVMPVLLLRASEFLWPLLLRQYLLGERETMTDVMAWRTDATRLPPRMYSDYLRRFFLGNDLAEGRYEVDGRRVCTRDIKIPVFAVGALDDFIAPWRAVYRVHSLTEAEVTFVLSDGDHHSGIIADPDDPQRSFSIATTDAGAAPVDPDAWRKAATCRSGRWWAEWQRWLVRHSGECEPGPLGRPAAGHAPLCDAPGSYVHRG
jgi:polyhydroxyalkanoate synthase